MHHKVCPVPQDGRTAASEKGDTMFSINNVLNRRSFLVGATLIFVPIYYTPASVLLKNAKDMSYDMTLMGADGMDSLCDPGRQVHRFLSAHIARPVRLFYSGQGRL